MDHDDTRMVKGAEIRVYSFFVFACIRWEMKLNHTAQGDAMMTKQELVWFASIFREILSILPETSELSRKNTVIHFISTDNVDALTTSVHPNNVANVIVSSQPRITPTRPNAF